MDDNEIKLDASLDEADTDTPEDNGEEKEPVNIPAEVISWVDTLLYAVLAIIAIFVFATRLSTVDGDSMNPTLEDGDRIMIANAVVPPKHNDIVVAWADSLPNEDDSGLGKPVVKRVIGVAGDRIDINFDAGTVKRNGETLPLEVKAGVLYEDGHMINTYTTDREDFEGEITVPEGYIFVMGDNRNNSTDSRSRLIGLIDTRYIIGTAYMRVVPSEKFGGID